MSDELGPRRRHPVIYYDIPLIFLTTDDEPYTEYASIKQSDAEMVIDIDSPGPSGRRYLIRGRPVNGFYAGQDEITEPKPLDVVARWTLLGDVWVGWWREEGVEFLFSFRLPKQPGGASRLTRKIK